MKNSFRDLNLGYFILTLSTGVLFSGISVIVPSVSGKMISAFAAGASDSRRLLAAFLTAGLAQLVFFLLDGYMSSHFKLRQKCLMRRRAFASFSKRDSAGQEEIAEFVSFLNNDIPTLAEQYYLGTIDIIKCICLLLFSAASLFSIHWALAAAVVIFSTLIVLAPRAMRKKDGHARKAYSEALGSYNASLHSLLNGLNIIAAYGYHSRANQIQEAFHKKAEKAESALIGRQLTVQGITGFLQVAKTVAILLLGVLLISVGQIEIGGLVAVVQLAEIISSPIEVLAYLIHCRNETAPLLERYEAVTQEDLPLREETGSLPGAFASLAVDKLSYRVGDLQILRDVSAVFEAGGNYLITGESGSGKSTLLRLMAQIGDLQYSGSIACGGKELREVSKTAYYKMVCPVFQEPYLFHAALEENILLGRPVPKAVYQSVLKKLNLEYLAERYQGQEITPEVMEQMSGGERQRVALARAMVRNPAVYLLDEATSALDAGNSERIEEMLLREGAAVIHVCHKPNPKLRPLYQKQFVLQDGKLLEMT